MQAFLESIAFQNIQRLHFCTGTSDPYCVMKLNGVERKTKVCWRKLDPVWNEEFVLYENFIILGRY